jgi:hypothetical protein
MDGARSQGRGGAGPFAWPNWAPPVLLLTIYLISRAFMLRDLPRPFCDEGFWTWAVVLWQRTGDWLLIPELPQVVLSPVNTLLWILWSRVASLNILNGRLLLVLLGAGTLLLTYGAARRSWGTRFAILATLPFVLGSYYFGFARSILLEPIVLFWCTLAWFLWVRRGRYSALLAGVAAGLALATKLSGGVILLAMLMDAFRPRMQTLNPDPRHARGLAALAGALGSATCLYGAFAVWTGPFFWNAWRDYGALNTQGTSWGILLQSTAGFVVRQPLLIMGSVVGLLYARRSGRAVFFPLAWLIAGVFITVATRAVGHWRLFVFFPPLCVFFAIGLEAGARLVRRLLPSVSRPLAVLVGIWILMEAGIFIGYHGFVVKERDALFRLAAETEASVARDRAIVSHPLLALVVDRPIVPFFGFGRTFLGGDPGSPASGREIEAIVFFDAIGGITPWERQWMEDPLTGTWTRRHLECAAKGAGGEIWIRTDRAGK